MREGGFIGQKLKSLNVKRTDSLLFSLKVEFSFIMMHYLRIGIIFPYNFYLKKYNSHLFVSPFPNLLIIFLEFFFPISTTKRLDCLNINIRIICTNIDCKGFGQDLLPFLIVFRNSNKEHKNTYL